MCVLCNVRENLDIEVRMIILQLWKEKREPELYYTSQMVSGGSMETKTGTFTLKYGISINSKRFSSLTLRKCDEFFVFATIFMYNMIDFLLCTKKNRQWKHSY